MALAFEKHILACDGKALAYRTTQKGQLRMGISNATLVIAEGLQEEPETKCTAIITWREQHALGVSTVEGKEPSVG